MRRKAAARAVASARFTRRACRPAASSARSRGTRRVFTVPGCGARAKTITAVASVAVIAHRQLARVGAQPVGEPQSPHEQYGTQHAVLLPAAAGCEEPVPQAERRS